MKPILCECEVHGTVEKSVCTSVDWRVYAWGRRFGVAVCIDGVVRALTIYHEPVLCSDIASAVHAAEFYILGKPWY